MSRKIYGAGYTFVPAAGTVEFASEISAQRQLLVIVNLTRGAMIYNFADPALGGTFSGATLTLTYDTSSHNAADILQIFYEPLLDVTESELQVLNNLIKSVHTDEGNTFELRVAPTNASSTRINPATEETLDAIDGKLGGTIAVSGPVTDAQLRASAVPVSVPKLERTLAFAKIDTTASGDTTLVAADGTRKIKVVSYAFVAAAAVNVTLKSGAGTALSGAMALAANSGVSFAGCFPAHCIETAVNQALVLNLSAGVQVSGHLCYFLEA